MAAKMEEMSAKMEEQQQMMQAQMQKQMEQMQQQMNLQQQMQSQQQAAAGPAAVPQSKVLTTSEGGVRERTLSTASVESDFEFPDAHEVDLALAQP